MGLGVASLALGACRGQRVGALVETAGETNGETIGTGDRWAEVDRVARATMAAQDIEDAGLAIYNAQDELVFERMYGDFTAHRRLAIASASKLVAGLVLFDLIREGKLSLESTTASVLGWTGDGSDITLRHLMSFTSGLERQALCTILPGRTLEQCVAAIRDADIVARPGVRFEYGSTHLHVAGRMAEVVTGQTWNALFRARLADPLGLPRDVLFYTSPRRAKGTTNPLIAGGMRASMNDYVPLLGMVFHRGEGRLPIGLPALFDAQAAEPYPSAIIGNSPMADAGLAHHYGLVGWLECAAPVTTPCPIVSSPGAFGFTPWIDREHGYYAIFAIEEFGATGGVAASSVRVATAVRAAIIDALAAR